MRTKATEAAGGRWAADAMTTTSVTAVAAKVAGTAGGSATPKAIPKPRAVGGRGPTTAKAAGTVTGRVIPKRPGVAGRAVTAPSVATTMKVRTGAGHATRTMTVVADVMRTIAVRAAVAILAMAAGPAIPKAIRRPRVAAGKTGAAELTTANPGPDENAGQPLRPP